MRYRTAIGSFPRFINTGVLVATNTTRVPVRIVVIFHFGKNNSGVSCKNQKTEGACLFMVRGLGFRV